MDIHPFHKVALVAGGACTVVLSILLVVCFVGDGCLIYEALNRRKDKKETARRMSGSLYGSSDKSLVNLKSIYTKDKKKKISHSGSIQSTGSDKTEHSLISRLGSVISNGSRQDSTYSSMSSGRTSPSSISARSSVQGESPTPGPPVLPPASPPSLTFSLLATTLQDGANIKLAINVESATDLPTRDYGAHCDPWVGVLVLKDRRSLRRRPPTPLAFFRTKTIRHAHNPFYSQTFVADIEKTDLRDIVVRLTVTDQDRHAGPTEMGSTSVNMKEAKQLVEDPEKFLSTQILIPPKRDIGEILFGMSYLPTAQRLSFTVTKISNLKIENKDKNENNEDNTTNPYVRILMFNQSGRLVKKKKTTVKTYTKDAVFNETLNFELAYNQLESCRFLVTVCNKKEPTGMEAEANQDSSDQEAGGPDRVILTNERNRKESMGKLKDECLGRVALGKYVRGEREREHYLSVIETPRKCFVVLHSLK